MARGSAVGDEYGEVNSKSTSYSRMKPEFKLRPWQSEDLTSLVKYANNWNVAKNMTDKFPFPYTESNGKAFIAFATADDPIHIFAIEVNGQAVKRAGGGWYWHSSARRHPSEKYGRRNTELGYWLAEPFWGQGIISAAIKQVVDFAFQTYAIDRVFARPFGTNNASQKVLEKNGFVLEGKFEQVLVKNGEVLDELIYSIRRAGGHN